VWWSQGFLRRTFPLFSSPKMTGQNDRNQRRTAHAHKTKLVSSWLLLDSKNSYPSSPETNGKCAMRERDRSGQTTRWRDKLLFFARIDESLEESEYRCEDWLTNCRGKEKGRGLEDFLLRFPDCAYLRRAVSWCAPLCWANDDRLPNPQAGDLSAGCRYTTPLRVHGLSTNRRARVS
jgi:hypothetical protein